MSIDASGQAARAGRAVRLDSGTETAAALIYGTLRIARGLLDGSIQPPERLPSKPTAYVAMGKDGKKFGPDGKPL